MPKNPFKPLNQFPNDEEASPRTLALPSLAPVPGITRPERPLDPEMKKERFHRLVGILKKPSIY